MLAHGDFARTYTAVGLVMIMVLGNMPHLERSTNTIHRLIVCRDTGLSAWLWFITIQIMVGTKEC